jgi:hypothetical protein
VDLQRDVQSRDINAMTSNFKQSPIKADSQALRGQKEEYLSNFNEKRGGNSSTPRQSSAPSKSQERIKKESEYLRAQRENFLSGFSNAPPPAAATYQQPNNMPPLLRLPQ